MRLQQILEGFKVLQGPVTGKLLGSQSQLEAHLLPDGAAYFGPFEQPLPAFVFFDTEHQAHVADSNGQRKHAFPELLQDMGVELMLLYDPRTYLEAAEIGIVHETLMSEYGEDRLEVEFTLYDMATRVLHLGDDLARFLERSQGSRYVTEIRRRRETFELRVGDRVLGGDSGPAEYKLHIA